MGSRSYVMIPLQPSPLGRKQKRRDDRKVDEDDEELTRYPRGRRERQREDKRRQRRERRS